MINIHDNEARTTKGRIRMAYSLNGAQPVLCTILCDQPLYYMEEEFFEEEEQSLFYEEEKAINAALGVDAAPLLRKINIYDGVAKKFEREDDARLGEFVENARSFDSNDVDGAALLQSTRDVLTHSRYAQSMMDYALALGTEIIISEQVRGVVYDAHAHVILFNADQTDADAQLNLVAALRTLVQINNGAGHHPLGYHPDEAVLVNRAQAADLAVAQIRVGWELQLAGQMDAWARLEQSQASDLARAFAREALSDFRTLNNGRAAQAAFESWFLSDRCKIEDRDLIQAMLNDQEARRFEEIQHQVGPAFFAALGEQTLGKNYLTDMTGLIMTDPVFSDVRDRSNANFLWFVKFERSFKDAEQELHGEDGETIHSPGAATLSFPAVGKDKKHDAISNACEWNSQTQGALAELAALEDASNQTNIVYVSFGRG